MEFLEDGTNEYMQDNNIKQSGLVVVSKKVQDDSHGERSIEEHQPYRGIVCEGEDLIQNISIVDFKNDQCMELHENDEKRKYRQRSCTFKSLKCEKKSKLEFSKDYLQPIRHSLVI